MKKALKIFLLFISSIILIAGGFALYLYANTSVMKNYFVGKLNEQLDAKISIHDIDLSLFSQFPKVSLDLSAVEISDPLSEKKHLLQAQHIYIGFNIYDILSKNYTIKQITVDSGVCNIFCDKAGNYNFNILKKDSTTKQENIFLQLKNIQFNKTDLNYTDIQSNQQYNLFLKNITMSGSFTKSIEDIACKGDLFVKTFKTGSVNLIKNKNTSIDFIFGIDNEKKNIAIKKGLLKIDELLLDVEGNIDNHLKESFIDLKFNAKQLSIQNLLTLLPIKFDAIKDYESNGEIYFNGSAKGTTSAKTQPLIQVNFGIKNGILKRISSNLTVENINCSGHFSNGEKRSAESSLLEVTGLTLKINNGTVSGDLSVKNLSHPFIDAQLSGKLEAAQLVNLLNNKNIKSADGNINFNMTIKGNANDFTDKNNWSKTHSSGNFEIDLQHIKVADERKEIALIKASLSLNQNDILINSFHSKVQQSDIDIKGKLLNVIPYFLKNNQQLEANIDYTSTYIDINHFIMPFSSNINNPNDTLSKNENPLQLPENIFLKAKMNVSKLVFSEFEGTNINALINWKGKKISVENLSCQTMNGNIVTSGQVENTADGRFLVTATTALKNINVNELFRQCKNFGQHELTNKHLFGIVNATFDLASVWSEKLDCDLDKLYAFGDMQILNGEIINYKPLEGLSKYADVEDLRHIRFSELKNKIEIKNKMIFIPNMDVKSNALNITLSGTHTFGNIVDYKLKIKLSELLKKKRKPTQNDFGEEDDENGKGLYLFLTMKGPIDNSKISYDKLGVKNKMKQDIKIEKQNIKELFKKELGIGKDSSIKEKKNDNNELEFEQE
ncbi:MAG: AsmA-like C-terminal region-containing protein [Bacteroidota bacterium]